MRGQLRGFYSADVPDALESYVPEDPENFALQVAAFIGPNESGGEEMFDFTVCTARWLIDHPPEKRFWFLHGYILLTRWDFAVLERALRDLAAHTTGESWQEIATRLNRFGRWEFEDYRE